MSLEPKYRTVQQFRKVEAVLTKGARHGEAADPIDISVRVTPSTDVTDVLEEVRPGPRLRRLRTGTWLFECDPTIFTDGVLYVANWHYAMTPANYNTVRDSFVWHPVPEIANDVEDIVVYGTFTDIQGAPLTGGRLVVEKYKDFKTLASRIGAIDTTADAFGNWWLELSKGALFRFVLDQFSKTVQLPTDGGRVALADLPDWQGADAVRRDRFGHPYPGDLP